ncbi:hypothetical protein RI367_006458 [Sorochytrium milnesiophthora]
MSLSLLSAAPPALAAASGASVPVWAKPMSASGSGSLRKRQHDGNAAVTAATTAATTAAVLPVTDRVAATTSPSPASAASTLSVSSANPRDTTSFSNTHATLLPITDSTSTTTTTTTATLAKRSSSAAAHSSTASAETDSASASESTTTSGHTTGAGSDDSSTSPASTLNATTQQQQQSEQTPANQNSAPTEVQQQPHIPDSNHRQDNPQQQQPSGSAPAPAPAPAPGPSPAAPAVPPVAPTAVPPSPRKSDPSNPPQPNVAEPTQQAPQESHPTDPKTVLPPAKKPDVTSAAVEASNSIPARVVVQTPAPVQSPVQEVQPPQKQPANSSALPVNTSVAESHTTTTTTLSSVKPSAPSFPAVPEVPPAKPPAPQTPTGIPAQPPVAATSPSVQLSSTTSSQSVPPALPTVDNGVSGVLGQASVVDSGRQVPASVNNPGDIIVAGSNGLVNPSAGSGSVGSGAMASGASGSVTGVNGGSGSGVTATGPSGSNSGAAGAATNVPAIAGAAVGVILLASVGGFVARRRVVGRNTAGNPGVRRMPPSDSTERLTPIERVTSVHEAFAQYTRRPSKVDMPTLDTESGLSFSSPGITRPPPLLAMYNDMPYDGSQPVRPDILSSLGAGAATEPIRHSIAAAALANAASASAPHKSGDYRTVYIPYVPELEDELELQVGDLVSIEQVFQDNWAVGENMTTRQTGCFPLVCCNKEVASSIESVISSASSAGGSLPKSITQYKYDQDADTTAGDDDDGELPYGIDLSRIVADSFPADNNAEPAPRRPLSTVSARTVLTLSKRSSSIGYLRRSTLRFSRALSSYSSDAPGPRDRSSSSGSSSDDDHKYIDQHGRRRTFAETDFFAADANAPTLKRSSFSSMFDPFGQQSDSSFYSQQTDIDHSNQQQPAYRGSFDSRF